MAKQRPVTVAGKTRKSITSNANTNANNANNAAVARPNAARVHRTRRAAPSGSSPPTVSAWHAFVSSVLPLALVTAVAYAAVAYGFTTAPAYIRSKPLMAVFKRAFIALVCLTSRRQLHHVYFPSHKPTTLRHAVGAHAKALAVVVLANCAGTTVIQPLFGQPPAYAKTIELVVPIYVAVECAVGLAAVPTAVLQFVVGFLVSWLKAATMSTLVTKWREDNDAHPVAFVLICTCNLFASGLVLRYVAHYHASRRLVALSFPVVWSLLQSMGVATVVGLLAHIANHLSTQHERQLEAAALYFAVAWFALNKYWKPSLRNALVYFLTRSQPKSKRD